MPHPAPVCPWPATKSLLLTTAGDRCTVHRLVSDTPHHTTKQNGTRWLTVSTTGVLEFEPQEGVFGLDGLVVDADFLSVDRATVYRLMAHGDIDYRMVGKRRRVSFDELVRYLDREP